MSYQPNIIAAIDERLAGVQRDLDKREQKLQQAIDAVDGAATDRLENAFTTISQELAGKASAEDVQEIHAILETKEDKPKDEEPVK